jgi:surfactin synthase thioesterase subunit
MASEKKGRFKFPFLNLIKEARVELIDNFVICFPWAGGGRSSYPQIFKGKNFQDTTEIWTISYCENDGFNRHENLRLFLEELKPSILSLMRHKKIDTFNETRCTFIGYSYGGIIAFEMIRFLEQEFFPLKPIVNFIVCAVAAPQYISENHNHSESTRF